MEYLQLFLYKHFSRFNIVLLEENEIVIGTLNVSSIHVLWH